MTQPIGSYPARSLPMDRRILCVWLPYWATTRLRHARTRSGAPPDDPLATAASVRGMRRLVAVCERAEAAGLHPGQALTQARALCPAVVVAESEPAEDAAALAALAQWTTRFTPLAAAVAPDTLWLDIAGCAHLFAGEGADGEAGLGYSLAARLQRWGLAARWAVAGTTGAAYALACHDAGRVIRSGEEAAALAALPIEALRLDAGDAAGLRRLGLKTVGALARLPRAELAARYGPHPGLRLDQASGAVMEPIVWPAMPADWSETERLAEPILTTEACMAVLEVLARRLCARLAAGCVGVRHCVAQFRRVDGGVHALAVATALPVQDPVYLLRLLAERLDGLDPGFGIDSVTLAAPATDAAVAQQTTLGGQTSGQVQQRLAQLIDTLSNRLHPSRLWRIAPRDSHVPEGAVSKGAVLPRVVKGGAAASWPSADTPRPIRLFRHPEPIEVTAPLPDDPPVQFRWRGVLHRVRAATGPERIADEWWVVSAAAAQTGARDYYQVEDREGARFWMFRTGQDWFVHGLFG